MTYGNGVRLTADHHRNSSRKSLSQNVFGGAALACIVLGCAWTLTANVLGTGADPAAVSASVEPVRVRQRRNLQRALRCARRRDGRPERGAEIGARCGQGIRRHPQELYGAARRDLFAGAAARIVFGDDAARPRSPARDAAAGSIRCAGCRCRRAAQRAAESVPMPASRPSTLRLLASREVAKAKAAILAVTAEKPVDLRKAVRQAAGEGVVAGLRIRGF